jgi:hypothetical protein
VKIFFSALLAAACLAGCAHGQAQFSSGAVSGAPGGTAGVGVQGGGSGVAALIGIGVAAAVIYGSGPDGTMTGSAKPAPLAPGRRVSEQDCSRPIEDPSANLKCR